MRRCLILRFPFIPPSKRLTEMELGKKVHAFGPRVMGAMFSIVSRAMTLAPKYADLKEKPRTIKSLTRRMDRLRPALRDLGWEFTDKQEMKDRVRQQVVEFLRRADATP